MTPVKQTVLWAEHAIGNGNCFAACLASLLDLPLWMVPPFEQMFGRGDWRARVQEWLERFFRVRMIRREDHDPSTLPEFYIANGLSPRGVHHSVIFCQGELAHDPHYSNDGIKTVLWTWHFESIDAEGK